MNSLNAAPPPADTLTGSFLSGCWGITRGELAACTLLFLGIPSLLLLSSRWSSHSFAAQDIRVISTSGPAAAPQAPNPYSARLDLNKATVRELELLPGIGPVRARKIIDYRAAHGPYASPSELQKVPGMPPALARRLEVMLVTPP